MEQPTAAIAKHVVILSTCPGNAAARAVATVAWMSSMGVTPLGVTNVISSYPMIISISLANLVAVNAWLCSELGVPDSLLRSTFEKNPKMYGCRPSSLSSKLAAYKAAGFNDSALSRIVLRTPQVLNCSVEHIQAQLSALRLLGLSKNETCALVLKMPTLMKLNISGAKQQAKVRYLTLMGRDIWELNRCSAYLTYSLFDRIGPRLAFLALYSDDKRPLTSILNRKTREWVETLKSPSLDKECLTRHMNHMQLFGEFEAAWKLGEGQQWLYEGDVKPKEKRAPHPPTVRKESSMVAAPSGNS